MATGKNGWSTAARSVAALMKTENEMSDATSGSPALSGQEAAADQSPRKMVMFSTDTAPSLMDDGIMSAPEISPSVWEEVDLSPWIGAQHVSVPFKSAGPDNFSLVYSRFAPGFRLPRHSHSADCLYYVLSGEFTMGTRTFRKGDGFFIQADAPYAYTAGPEGLEILEFRASTSFDMKVYDQTPERWRAIVGSLAPATSEP